MPSDELTRRALIQAALLAGCRPALAEEKAVPVFRNLRHQFTELDPVHPMRPIRLSRPDGRAGILSATSGRVLLVNVWATWCPTCRTDLPALARARALLSSRGIDAVAVSNDIRPAREVALFLHGLAIDSLPVLLDPDGATLQADLPDGSRSPFSTAGPPVSFVIDAEGKIRGYLVGAADWGQRDAVRFLQDFATS